MNCGQGIRHEVPHQHERNLAFSNGYWIWFFFVTICCYLRVPAGSAVRCGDSMYPALYPKFVSIIAPPRKKLMLRGGFGGGSDYSSLIMTDSVDQEEVQQGSSMENGGSETACDEHQASAGDEEEDDSEEREEMATSIANFRHRSANWFTQDELEQIQREWQDDSRWKNATLNPPVDNDFDSTDSFEAQWEQERLHGDLNQFRHSHEPTEQYLLWKLQEELAAEEAAQRKRDAINCADDMSMPSEDEDNPEENYYFNGRGETVWRPPNSVAFEKYSNKTELNWEGLFKERTGQVVFMGKEDATEMAQHFATEMAQHFAKHFLGCFMYEYEKQVRRYGDGALELEALLSDEQVPFEPPDVSDEASWSRWGVYTKDHGIDSNKLAIATAPPGRDNCERVEVCAGDAPLSHYLSGGNGRLASFRLRQGVHEAAAYSSVCVTEAGEWMISGDEGSIVKGRLHIPSSIEARGKISGLGFQFVCNEVGGVIDELGPGSVVEPCLRIESGTWSIGWCDVRVSGGQAVRCAFSSNVTMFASCVGGMGPLGERAYDGVVVMNVSYVQLSRCTVEACFLGGARVRHNATLRIDQSHIRLCGYGVGCRDQGLMHVEGCILSNFTQEGSFFTFSLFTRTSRATLINNTIYGMPWVGGVKPRRTFERGTKYVGWEPKVQVSAAVRKSMKRMRQNVQMETESNNQTCDGRAHGVVCDEQGKLFGRYRGINASQNPVPARNGGHLDCKKPSYEEGVVEANYKELMRCVKDLFKCGDFVGNFDDPTTWALGDDVKKAIPKQSEEDRLLQEQIIKEHYPDAPTFRDIPRIIKNGGVWPLPGDVGRLKGGGYIRGNVRGYRGAWRGNTRGSRARTFGRGDEVGADKRGREEDGEEIEDLPEQSYTPILPNDRAAHLFVAHLHGEDIRPLKLQPEERKIVAKMWKVKKDECTNEIYYWKPSTQETRWNLPRGLLYVDLHGHSATAKFCDLVIPDCLPANVSLDIDWAGLIVASNSSGNWTEYRERYSEFRQACRKVIFGAKPHTRIYFRLAEPYRFEGEMVCDDMQGVVDDDWKQLAESETGMQFHNIPRMIWFEIASEENGQLSRFVSRPHMDVWRGFSAEDEEFAKELEDMEERVHTEEAKKEVFENNQGGVRQGMSKYKRLQKQYNKARMSQVGFIPDGRLSVVKGESAAQESMPWGSASSSARLGGGRKTGGVRGLSHAKKLLFESQLLPDVEDYELEGEWGWDYDGHEEENDCSIPGCDESLDPKFVKETRHKIEQVLDKYGISL